MKTLGDLGAVVSEAHADWLRKAELCASCSELARLGPRQLCWTCEGAAQRERATEAAADALARGLRGAWEVPQRYRWAHVDAPEWSERVRVPVSAVRRVAAARPMALFVHGAPGAGKSCAVVAAARIAHPRGLAFAPAVRLSGGAFTSPEDLLSAPCVLVDDLGTEKTIASSLVVDVIHERHARDMPIWITSNLRPSQIAGRYGAGTARRLLENGIVLYAR